MRGSMNLLARSRSRARVRGDKLGQIRGLEGALGNWCPFPFLAVLALGLTLGRISSGYPASLSSFDLLPQLPWNWIESFSVLQSNQPVHWSHQH